jgi:DNA-directed RNA polymerase subunit beta
LKIKSYSRIKKKAEMAGLPQVEVPNLLAMQIESFDAFLQRDIHPAKRDEYGLQSVMHATFPLQDAKGYYLLEYIDYIVLKEKYSIQECIERNLSYQAPIKARMRLTVYDEELLKETGEQRVKNTIEQDVFLGEIPLITPGGTFVINGAERVIISQLHRSPGIFFSEEKHPSGKSLYSAKLIPYTGSWLEFTMDSYDAMFVLIDKRRKLPATVLLRAVGLSSNDDLRDYFYDKEEIAVQEAKGRYLFTDLIDHDTGEVIFDASTEIDEDVMESLTARGINTITVVTAESEIAKRILEQTIAKDQTTNSAEALKKLYTLIRPGEEPSETIAKDLFNRMFFNERRYNLGPVGRYKLNERLQLDINL